MQTRVACTDGWGGERRVRLGESLVSMRWSGGHSLEVLTASGMAKAAVAVGAAVW